MSESRWRTAGLSLGAIWLIALGLILCTASAQSPSQNVEEEYARRVQALAADDIEGHYELALWCKEQEAWDLLRKQCVHILRLKPDHEQAKLLLELARTKLGGGAGGDAGVDPRTGAGGEDVDFVRVITDEEIQILRRAELSSRFPERVRIEFHNDVVSKFADDAYGGDREARARFMKLPPAAKAQTILTSGLADRFVRDIEVLTDPRMFADFERRAMPVILEGCATRECHGGPNAKGFRMITGRRLTKNQVYTNYLILHNYQYKHGDKVFPMIDRSQPWHSLVLWFGMLNPPVKRVQEELLTPPMHPVQIDPIYRNPNHARFQRVENWVQNLDPAVPDYGIDISPIRDDEKKGEAKDTETQ